MKKILFLLLLFVPPLVFGQGNRLLHGKVQVSDAMVRNILVLNLTNEKETHTDSLGRFKIEAQLDDLLVFYAPHLDKMRKLIDDEAFFKNGITVEMTSKVEELEEVVVFNYAHINAYDLGIIQKPIPLLTPAQRGKYGLEKKAEEFEAKLSAIEKLESLYDDAFLEQKLKIEKSMTKAFLFYAAEHSWFLGVLKGKNKSLTTFYLTMLAQKYNSLQHETPVVKSP